MSTKFPGLGVTGCYTDGECDYTAAMNESLQIIAAEHFGCATGQAGGTLINVASNFDPAQVGDSYVDAVGCFFVYLGADKGWQANPPICGRVVFDTVNKISYVWDDGSWKALTVCQTITSNSIAAKGTSAYPTGTLGYNDTAVPWVEFITIDGLWQPTGRLWDNVTCEFTYVLTKEQVEDCLLFCVQADTVSQPNPPAGKIGVFSFGGTLYKVDDTGAVDFFICDEVYQAGLVTIFAAIQLVQDQIDAGINAYAGTPAAGLLDAGKLVKADAAGLLDPCFISKYPVLVDSTAFVTKYGIPTGGERFYNSVTGRVEIFDAVLGSWRDEAEAAPNETFIAVDEKAYDVPGGALLGNTWNTRTLNTETATASWASLSANQVTLTEGACYLISAIAPGFSTDRGKIRIFNVTDGVIVSGSLGTNSLSDNTSPDVALYETDTEFCITSGSGDKAIEIQHWTNNPVGGANSGGLSVSGPPGNPVHIPGGPSIYSRIVITRQRSA